MKNPILKTKTESHSSIQDVSKEEYARYEPKEECDCYRLPLLGDYAPEFDAMTTQGQIKFPEDYTGKWVILFSHPSNFTSVCTSEFITLASMQKEFDALNTQLIGLAVDGLASHIAWLRVIKEKIEFNGHKNVEITFPVIADIGMEISEMYGMIQPGESGTKTVRAVFFICPRGTIRALIYYPLSMGRNFDEIKRVVIALQTSDANDVSTPANWMPSDDVFVPAPVTYDGAKERMESRDRHMKCQDWFFCTKKLPIEELNKPSKK